MRVMQIELCGDPDYPHCFYTLMASRHCLTSPDRTGRTCITFRTRFQFRFRFRFMFIFRFRFRFRFRFGFAFIFIYCRSHAFDLTFRYVDWKA